MKYLFLILFIANSSFAHPGRTASDGCHFCRSNCSSYGYTSSNRHSHNGEQCDPGKGQVDPVLAGKKRGGSESQQAVLPLKYNRKHFRHWIDEDGDCRSRRAEVLKARSLVEVIYRLRKNGKKCTVDLGEWKDYYFPEVLRKASDAEIDHLVPLKHAWDMGASSWSAEKRKAFANDPENLVITNGRYNSQKGAQTPLSWAPSKRTYYCKYLKDWIKIKSKYGLPIANEIYDFQKKAHCE